MAVKKSKTFRVATEGATADGRVIDRAWIQQMADSYDPAVYRATVNIEHIRSALPDSPFKNYGVVDRAQAIENASGKLELFVAITPTDDLVRLTRGMQKVFSSIEVNPKFAGTGKAYLVGLAVTDTPASLGTEMLAFTAAHPAESPLTARKQHADNAFSVATETAIEFIDATDAPGVLERVRQRFAKKAASDDARFADLAEALHEVAEHGQTQSTRTAEQLQQVDQDIRAHRRGVDDLIQRLARLEQLLDTTAAHGITRPTAQGDGRVLTTF